LSNHQKPLTETAEEAQIMELSRLASDTADAIAIVRFSMQKDSKNLLMNGDHKPKSQGDRVTTPPGRYEKQAPKIPKVGGTVQV
jgi:hypothetical protein